MTQKGMGKPAALLLFVLIFAALACAGTALAADAELIRLLPGAWTNEQDETEEAPLDSVLLLSLEENGAAVLRCGDRDGKYTWSCTGTWAFEYVEDYNDRLTLLFTRTDGPQAADGYSVECVYEAYAESWVENDTRVSWLILTPVRCSGVSPFEEAGIDWEISLHREQGPNMRVVNCASFVSLREKRSASSKRLFKVPLGAQVLAFPEEGEENGFILCVYRGEYGYILAEYLQPVD